VGSASGAVRSPQVFELSRWRSRTRGGATRKPRRRAKMGKDKDKIKISKKKEKSVRVQPCCCVGAHVGGTS